MKLIRELLNNTNPTHSPVSESVESADSGVYAPLYGVDSDSAEGDRLHSRFMLLKHTDPDLYKRIASLD